MFDSTVSSRGGFAGVFFTRIFGGVHRPATKIRTIPDGTLERSTKRIPMSMHIEALRFRQPGDTSRSDN